MPVVFVALSYVYLPTLSTNSFFVCFFFI